MLQRQFSRVNFEERKKGTQTQPGEPISPPVRALTRIYSKPNGLIRDEVVVENRACGSKSNICCVGMWQDLSPANCSTPASSFLELSSDMAFLNLLHRLSVEIQSLADVNNFVSLRFRTILI